MVSKTNFFGYEKYEISSDNLRASAIALGAICTSIEFAGRNLVLNYGSPEEYKNGTGYVGAIVGRVANRISGASFSIDGREYHLTRNENGNHIHGGVNAFDRQRWDAKIMDDNAVRFSYTSPDGDNGYPGNLTACVTYRIEDDRLRISFEAESDKDTIFAPTPHMYFNLGENKKIQNTQLQINSDKYLPVNSENIPAGDFAAARDRFDFRTLRAIGQNYDHCFLLNSENACVASDGGVKMQIRTDFPALHLYTGEFLAEPFEANSGFALEPEFCPDSVNQRLGPSPILRKGEYFKKYIEYRFCKE